MLVLYPIASIVRYQEYAAVYTNEIDGGIFPIENSKPPDLN